MRVRSDVALAGFTTLGLGGPARELVEAESERELIDAVRESDARGEPVLVLGGGSNLVIADEGFRGRVVRVATRGVEAERDGGAVVLRAAAGEVWDDLVARAVDEKLAGLECLSGIPGLVGATPIQNVGAYGQEVADTITAVRAWDRREGHAVELAPSACEFAYRDSAFKGRERGRYVVLEVCFGLRRGGAPAVRYAELARALASQGEAATLGHVRETVIALRRAKAMVLDANDVDTRSAGSFFMNPIVDETTAREVEARARAAGVLGEGETMPRFAASEGRVKLAAGWLIERAGFAKGTRHGSVGISTRHALALVNRDGATTRELIELARRVRDGVRARFGVTLAAEPVFEGFGEGDPWGDG